MPKKVYKVRLSMVIYPSRRDKLKRIAEAREKDMTQLVEDWIDTLEDPAMEVSA